MHLRWLKTRWYAPSLALVLGPACNLQAQDVALTLGNVQVSEHTRRSPSTARVLSSVDVIGGELLHDQHVDYSWELLMRAPGMQVTQFRMGTDAGRFSFRGFNGEGRINAVKLLIDGIPSNDNAGAMPYLDAVFPQDISAIEIVRGTNDARYGLNAIAGSVDVVTRTGGNDGYLSVTAGSFDAREIQLGKGFERGAWSQNYVLAWRDSDGYRDHADARKRGVAGKWFYTAPEGAFRAGLTTRYYDNHALEAGYLDAAAARAAPRRSPDYAQNDQSERRVRQTALHADGEFGEQMQLSAKAYQNDYRNRRWVRFSAAGLQQERDTDEAYRGLLLIGNWQPNWGALDANLEAGVDAQWQNNQAQRYRSVARVRGVQLRDWMYDLHTRGAYVQAVLTPFARLQLVPGYRIDHVGGQLHDVLAGIFAPSYDYGTIKQPKFSASYHVGEQSSVYANWGRTFQIGSGDGAYRRQPGHLWPSINDGWEVGFKFAPSSLVDGRLAYWEQRASGEVATILGVNGVAGIGEVANVGRTLRRGWDAQLNLQPVEHWHAWVSYSRQKASIATPDPSAPATRGKEIENVPHWLASAGVEWQVRSNVQLNAWGNAQGDYYLERTNTLGRTGGYCLLNLGARWNVDARNTLGLQLRNLTDRAYVYAWYDSGSTGYSPGDGRALSLSWDVSF